MISLLDPAVFLGLLAGDSGWQLGAARFSVGETLLLLLSFAAMLASALGLWRTGKRDDRQARLAVLHRAPIEDKDAAERPPPLAWYSRLGTMVMRTPINRLADRQRMITALAEAGISADHHHVGEFLACKLGGALLLAALWWWASLRLTVLDAVPLLRWCVVFIALLLGSYLADVLLARVAARRKARLEHGLPDALDLLVLCSEAGLSLQQAIDEVARALEQADPDIAAEFAMTAAEFRILPDRTTALENMAKRTGIASLRGLISTLNQSLRFGTSLGESLRILSTEMRAMRLARIEEQGARLPVLLAVPLMLFLMPALMIVIMSPVALRIADTLSSLGVGQ